MVATAILGGRKKKQVSIGTSFEDALCAVLRTMRFLCTGDECGGRKRREAEDGRRSFKMMSKKEKSVRFARNFKRKEKFSV